MKARAWCPTCGGPLWRREGGLADVLWGGCRLCSMGYPPTRADARAHGVTVETDEDRETVLRFERMLAAWRNRQDEANGWEFEVRLVDLEANEWDDGIIEVMNVHGIPARLSERRIGIDVNVTTAEAARFVERITRERERLSGSWMGPDVVSDFGHTWRDVMGLYVWRYDPETGRPRGV